MEKKDIFKIFILVQQVYEYQILNTNSCLTLFWVGILVVHFEVGMGVVKLPPLSKTY